MTQSSCLEGYTAKGITIKAYVRLLSKRSPIILGETKQMLEWTGFSTTFDVTKFIKVPLWNNNKITGHVSLSYTFSKTPKIQNYKNNFSEKNVENIIEIEDYSPIEDKQQPLEFSSIPMSISTNKDKNELFMNRILCQSEGQNHFCNTINSQKGIDRNYLSFNKLSEIESIRSTKEKEIQTNCIASCQKEDQMYLFNKIYPERDKNFVEFNAYSLKKSVKETKEIQTDFKIRQFNKSAQTQFRTHNVAIQVVSDELLEDPMNKSICYDVQNIFRCTHEFTLNIEKKCNSTFNYVTYQFPECVTNNIGKSKIIII